MEDLSKQLSKLSAVLPRIVAEEAHKTYVMCPEEATALRRDAVKRVVPSRYAGSDDSVRQRLRSDASRVWDDSARPGDRFVRYVCWE